jgi:UDPglucose 6-dehydrogenase
MEKIGVIGQGFVGSAVTEKFKEKFIVYAYDKFNEGKSITYNLNNENETPYNDITELVRECDIIFVCVPTPMFQDGECDTRIVESVINEIATECKKLDRAIIAVLKSTVPPRTTLTLNNISDRVSVCFNPEFLTEANAIQDYKNQDRIILGIDMLACETPLKDIFLQVFPNARIHIISSNEAEMVKYFTNLFLATKVSFFNDMYQMCRVLEIDYDRVVNIAIEDTRIGNSHHRVPGPDGDFGYGGHCFPKDMNAILFLAHELGVPVPTLTGAHVTNQIVRSNRDWEKMEGRAFSKREETEIQEN